MGKIKSIIFDFDGTTADTTPCISYSTIKTYREIGIEPDPDMIATNMGLTLRQFLALFFQGDDEALFERVCRRYEEVYRTEGIYMVKLFDHVLETLAKLKAAGIKLAIGSNNVQVALQYYSKALGLDKYIDEIVCVDDVEHVKPAPDIAIEIMRRFNTTPDETLVVGDSTYDIDMAIAAKCPTCGVTYGAHSADKLRKAGCQATIDSFDELIEFVLGK